MRLGVEEEGFYIASMLKALEEREKILESWEAVL